MRLVVQVSLLLKKGHFLRFMDLLTESVSTICINRGSITRGSAVDIYVLQEDILGVLHRHSPNIQEKESVESADTQNGKRTHQAVSLEASKIK